MIFAFDRNRFEYDDRHHIIIGSASKGSALRTIVDDHSPEAAIEQIVPGLRSLMSSFGCPWSIAGGWAVDLHLGQITRQHGDLEITVLRQDQGRLHDLLIGWSLSYLEAGKSHPWSSSLSLKPPIH